MTELAGEGSEGKEGIDDSYLPALVNLVPLYWDERIYMVRRWEQMWERKLDFDLGDLA